MSTQKTKISLYTSRFGGPYQWGCALATYLKKHSPYRATVYNKTLDLLASPILRRGDLVHSIIPIHWSLWRAPYLLTIKGDYTREDYIWRHLYPSATRKADRVTVPSQYLKERLNLEKAEVIPNAMDFDALPHVTLKDRERLNILTVTTFWFPQKADGVLDIVQTLERLPSALQSRVHYTVVGEGPHRERIQKAVENSPINIKFEGFQDPKTYFPDADIFLYYSHHDNMPNSVMEAMGAGLPVICNRVAATPEIIGESGKVGYLAHDADEYLEQLTALMTSFERRHAMGREGRAFGKAHFSWDNVIQQWINIYKELL